MQYGAEREAEIRQLLAHHPERPEVNVLHEDWNDPRRGDLFALVDALIPKRVNGALDEE